MPQQASGKQRMVAAARKLGLLPAFEYARYMSAARKAAAGNRAFLAQNPDFVAPPLWWLHDMYAHASYELYMTTGRDTATGITERIDRLTGLDAPRVADWGCGLARVSRHLPSRYRVHGFDYNAEAIAWCSQNIAGRDFSTNGLRPPLPAEAASFDALFALSVFTHLSPEGHTAWFAEIARVLAPGGVFLGAFHTAPAADQLLAGEREQFAKGELVVRGGVHEGGRTYTAYHPTAFLTATLSPDFEIIEGPTPFFGQGLVVARRR